MPSKSASRAPTSVSFVELTGMEVVDLLTVLLSVWAAICEVEFSLLTGELETRPRTKGLESSDSQVCCCFEVAAGLIRIVDTAKQYVLCSLGYKIGVERMIVDATVQLIPVALCRRLEMYDISKISARQSLVFVPVDVIYSTTER